MLNPQPASPPAYAELHCLSNFSFQRGASHPEELVERAAGLGYRALALTDECSLAGVVRAHQHIRQQQLSLQLIIGSEIQLSDGPRLVLLATNRRGYAHLSRLISKGRRAATKGHYHLTRHDIETAGLNDCLALLAPPTHQALDTGSLEAQAHWLLQHFAERCWLIVSQLCSANDAQHLQQLKHIASHTGIRLVGATGALMHCRSRRRLADVLTATRLHTTVMEAGLQLAPNAEASLHDRHILSARYPADLLAETVSIAARCQFSLSELRYEYPSELVPAEHTPAQWLRKLVEQGVRRRYRVAENAADPAPPKVRQQIEHELQLIADLNYESYFLTVHDIVRFARSQGILCQGRGSAANSVVCWTLGITEVDPQLGIMLVERFISRERNEPPDIDVDFEHSRREEVIQYIYTRYGRERAALAATVICYRPRSALRDVGRALGFPLSRIERLTRDHFWFDGKTIVTERVREAGLDPDSRQVRLLLELTHELIGFPRHLSQHVGGFVIARDRLDELVPVENAAMPERTVIQWDKDDLDALGLLKIDVLALGMLSALRRTLALVSDWRNKPFNLADIPREVPAVYHMLSNADSIGVFQVESRAQMTMLPRLSPERFYDLVVEVAIVRPGPIQGGMVHPYLAARERARQGLPIDYPRPAGNPLDEGVRPVLERTLGVPIFQEQVMQLAVVAAGFTPGEADQLRRSMGAWRRKGELEQYRIKLINGMAERGYSTEFSERLCSQIEGFGSYGFPESHAASFALLVYFSAWLKCFEPAAFLCGLLNSQPMGFYAPSQLIQDARRHGVEVRPPDVCASHWDCTLEASNPQPAELTHHTPGPAPQPAARLGLRVIKGLSQSSVERIMTARTVRHFESVQDLAHRAQLDNSELKRLANAGALSSLAGHRRQALWQAAAERTLDGLLQHAPVQETPASLPAPSEAHDLIADYAKLGFSLGRHPLAFLRSQLAERRFITADATALASDRQLVRVAGLVTCRQRPGTAKGTLFITLEDETGLTNIIVRPQLIEHQRRELLSARLLGVYGQITRQGKVVHVQAGRVVDLSELLGQLDVRSRDFH